MAAPPSAYKDRHFLAVIGDEVSALLKAELDEQVPLANTVRTQ